jgi:hypothetical protein
MAGELDRDDDGAGVEVRGGGGGKGRGRTGMRMTWNGVGHELEILLSVSYSLP